MKLLRRETMSRQKDDFYPTPLVAVESLLDNENFDGDIWEPVGWI